jgi:hypothetical protein
MSRRFARKAALITTAVVMTALVAGATTAPALTEKTLKFKILKVKPSGKTAKISLRARGSTLYLVLYVKKGTRYVELDRTKVRKKLPATAKLRPLSAGQGGAAYAPNGGQGLVAWDGPDDSTHSDDFAQYFGWNIAKKTIEFF